MVVLQRDLCQQPLQPLHLRESKKADVRLPEKGNAKSHGAKLVHQIITMIKWIRTSRLSIKNSLSAPPA